MTNARAALQKLLAGLGDTFQFATAGNRTPVLPGLDVTGVGTIGCPVSQADAKRVIAVASQAPYGRGEATILDPKVRRVWQLEPTTFALRNPSWGAELDAIVAAVRGEFGIAGRVSAELYKLLVYEKGSFFAPHRDSEKAPGMFATLVVGLPSRHQGGTLTVRHDGQVRTIDFGGPTGEFQTQYAAFYADCEHEIAPVTAGYRVALVYNLVLAGVKRQPTAPANSAAVEQLTDLLRQLFSGDLPNKLVVPFAHQYTPAGFDAKNLKGADRTRAAALARAAEALGYRSYVALVNQHTSGDADYDTFDSRGRWSDDEDDADGVEIGEVFEEDLWLDHWFHVDGSPAEFQRLGCNPNELLTGDDRKGWTIRQSVHEATGNEGATVDRWYHQAAFVAWPAERHFAVLADEGPASALPELEAMAGRAKSPEALAECATFADAIVGAWRPGGHPGEPSLSGRMAAVLERIGAVEPARRFVRDALPRAFRAEDGPALVALCERLGWTHFAKVWSAFVDRQAPGQYDADLRPAVAVCRSLGCDPPPLSAERREVGKSIADAFARLLQRWDTESHPYRRDRARKGVVDGATQLLATYAATAELDTFLDDVLATPKKYDLYEVLIPDVTAIYGWLPSLPAAAPYAERLRSHCRAALQAATATPVEPPKDWTRPADIQCRCADCAALAAFLRDPANSVARFAMVEKRRLHLESQIRHGQLDASCQTERTRSPHTLVCTKTQATYERRLKQYELDLRLLAELDALAVPATAVRKAAGRKKRN